MLSSGGWDYVIEDFERNSVQTQRTSHLNHAFISRKLQSLDNNETDKKMEAFRKGDSDE